MSQNSSNRFDVWSFIVRRSCAVIPMIVLIALTAPTTTFASADLTEMSLEELMNIEVTSVSKKSESKMSAAAAITVITADDIRRGGFTVIPEALRTVPGLQVARVDANRWAISVRGSTGLFANKLLVLIDGRSVYTPVFGGTYWDTQDYPIEDVERIEVIRGPGGTVWGANAVNGVINIITKHSKDTQGGLISGYEGSQQYGLTGRYGGTVGEDTQYRVYGRMFGFEDFDIDGARDGNDEWQQRRLGFRVDKQLSETDTLRVSADYFRQENEQGALAGPVTPAFLDVTYHQVGGNILVDWNRELADESSIQAKAYYAVEDREFLISETRHTWDLELQTNFSAMENVAVTVGGNYRYTTNDFDGTAVGLPIAFSRGGDELHLVSGFGQVQVSLFDDILILTGGTKLGHNNWSGFEYQPSGRITVAPIDGIVLWGAVSRAVRIPTQSERDINFNLPPIPTVPPNPFPVTLTGDRDTNSEELLAFELGFRFFVLERFNMEVALFWNEYENRSSFQDLLPAPPFSRTIGFANDAELTVRGAEVEFNVIVTDWWRLKAAYSYVHMDEDLGSTAIVFGDVADDNPEHQFNVQSFFELPYGIEFDASVYYTDSVSGTLPTLETKSVGDYVRLDLRLGYKPADWVEFSLVGQNLTDRRHYESEDFTAGRSTQVPRSGYGKITVNF